MIKRNALSPPLRKKVVKVKDGSNDGGRKEDTVLDANITMSRCRVVDKETGQRIIIAITLIRLERFHPADFCSAKFLSFAPFHRRPKLKKLPTPSAITWAPLAY